MSILNSNQTHHSSNPKTLNHKHMQTPKGVVGVCHKLIIEVFTNRYTKDV